MKRAAMNNDYMMTVLQSCKSIGFEMLLPCYLLSATCYLIEVLEFSLLCLNCDRFVIETIGISLYRNNPRFNHALYLDFFYHHQCTAQDLESSLDRIEKTRKLEYINCQFPIEGYIGNLLQNKYTRVARTDRKVKIAEFCNSSIHPHQLEAYQNRLSFQYLDTRIGFSDPRYKTKFETAIKPMGDMMNQDLIKSTAIAYRIAWLYYRSRNENQGIWTF